MALVGLPFQPLGAAAVPKPNWTVVEAKLRGAGLSRSFTAFLLKHYQKDSFQSTLRLNFLTFRSSPIQKNKITPVAVKKTTEFIQKNKAILLKAEKRFGVPKETIAALLWLETQHGILRGQFHVASVYVHLLQSERKEVLDYLVAMASKNKSFSDLKPKAIRKMLVERSRKRMRWAVDELKELQEIYRDDREYLIDLHGSFAGAFGIPQFIPSSYNSWAIAADKNKDPDLYDVKDAVMSVANYLHWNGWRKKDSKTHMKALMKYNNSSDYAKTILELARIARDKAIAVYR